MQASVQVPEAIAKLVPGGELWLSQLSDDELLTSTRRLVGASNQLLAQLLLHLAEVETRGIHRTRACASLYTYCIYELRMSEDAAARRSSAARLVKRFPLLFEAIARGELHLTGLLMLGPHLTPENHVEVLARAQFRTKKELAKLVRELHPLPRVPDLMQPLGPEQPGSVREPTWEEWVTSLCPPVRELKAGDAPGDWTKDPVEGGSPATGEAIRAHRPTEAGAEAEAHANANGDTVDFTAPARFELPPITPPQQYQMQFSTTEEHVRLVERARALLARSSPGVSLGELHARAMQLLVASLEKKFAVTAQMQAQAQTQARTQTRRGRKQQPTTSPHAPTTPNRWAQPRAGAPASRRAGKDWQAKRRASAGDMSRRL